jgi:hypothetical protein
MSDANRELPDMDSESGITEQERSEIQQQIDTIANENRISAEDAKFPRKSVRAGILFPVIVNGAAVIAVLIAIFVLTRIFQSDEQQVQNAAIEFTSIEGRLIRELRLESQQLLLTKDQEIQTVRQQLQQLESEQALLEASIAERISEREDALRAQLMEELDSERTRLTGEGLGNDEIESRMEAFEAERLAFYEAQLEEYREELEAERIALQADIDRLRAEYSQRLADLESERDSLISEYQDREDSLRLQLEQRTQVLELARVEVGADLEAAQRELSQLTRQTEERTSIENQIVGQIDSIRAAVRRGDDPDAVRRIDTLIRFMSADEVIAVSGLARRREMDIFLLRQLRELLSSRQPAGEGEARSITDELQLLGQIRKLSLEAAGAPSDEAARRTFAALLQAMPEVAQAHTAVVETALQTVREDERTDVAETAGQAARFAQLGNYAQALASYEEALGSAPSVEPDGNQIVTDILRLGYALTEFVIDGEETQGLQAVASRARIDLEGERARLEAMIQAAVFTKETEMQVEIDSLSARIRLVDAERADLLQQVEELTVEVTGLDQELDDAKNLVGARIVTDEEARAQQQELAQLESDLSIALRESSLNEEIARERQTQIVEFNARVTELTDERNALLADKLALESGRRELTNQYTAYAADQAVAISAGDFGRLQQVRESFFSSPALESFLPDLFERVREYESQFEADVVSDSLSAFRVTEIMEDLAATPSGAGRESLLAIELEDAAGDPALTNFLEVLQGLLTTTGN